MAGVDPARGQRIVGRRVRQQRERLAGHAAATRLLARMRGVEHGDGGAVPGEMEGEQRAGGAGADDRDLHACASPVGIEPRDCTR